MDIECWISLLELGLKIVFWWQVMILLRKIYRVMANTEKILDEALADLGLDEPRDDDTGIQEHRDTLVGLAQSGLLRSESRKQNRRYQPCPRPT